MKTVRYNGFKDGYRAALEEIKKRNGLMPKQKGEHDDKNI